MRGSNLNKDKTISIRLTAEEKERIKEKAKRENKSVSEYAADAALAGLERKSSKNKKMIAQMVRNQEALNEIFEIAKETEITDGLKEKIMKLVEGENKLWQCL